MVQILNNNEVIDLLNQDYDRKYIKVEASKQGLMSSTTKLIKTQSDITSALRL